MPHLTLVGDSVFDNDRYTYGAPDVASCLRELLPEWSVTLQARDGATLRQVGGQLAKLPAETTHVVASMGGNDLLALPFVMPARTATTGEFLAWLAREAQDFEQKYRLALRELISLNRVLTVCTVTGAGLPGDKGVNLRVLLNVFNDVIVRVATEHRVRVIELRALNLEPTDFVNSIEPSATGGRKIASAVAKAVAAGAA